jgi:branched-chain amino acid transport system permease protein
VNRSTLVGYAVVAAAIAGIWAIDAYAIPWVSAYVTDLLVKVGYNTLAVLGLALVLGFTGQFSLGHAGFMAVGAYGAAILTMNFGLPHPIATFCGGLLAALAGVVVGIPSLRLGGDYLAVVTLGFNQIIIVCILNWPMLGGASGLKDVPQVTTFGWTYTWLLLGVLFIRNLVKSPFGRTFEAVRDNEIATRSLGIDTTRVKVTAFVVGAFWAGIAGALVGFKLSFISPTQFQFDRSIELLAMVVLGGVGSLSGPVLASTVLTALPELLRQFSQYRMVAYSLLLIVMMVVRPKGFLGNREISDIGLGLWRRFGANRVEPARPA